MKFQAIGGRTGKRDVISSITRALSLMQKQKAARAGSRTYPLMLPRRTVNNDDVSESSPLLFNSLNCESPFLHNKHNKY